MKSNGSANISLIHWPWFRQAPSVPWLAFCLVVSLGLMVLLGVSANFSNANPRPDGNDLSTRQTPNWILPTLDGTPLSLYQIADSGATTVMVFWSSWCKTCALLLPKLEQLSRSTESNNIQFVLMNVWEDGDPSAYVTKHNLTIPTILQAEQVAKRYDIQITPGVVVVDANRQLVYNRPPTDTTEDVIAVINQLFDAQNSTQ